MFNADSLPELLTPLPFWLPANERKIPVLDFSNIHITGDRLGYCRSWHYVRPLIEQNAHPYAVYLHNQQEPYITLDIDHGRNPQTGEPADWLKPLFNTLGIVWDAQKSNDDAVYIEVSSSGTGYHVLFQGKTDYGKRSWFTTDQRGKNAPKLEIIAHNNLITYTGNQLPCSGQNALPIEPLLDYVTTTWPEQHNHTKLPPVTSQADIPQWRQQHDRALSADQIADMLDRLNPDCHHEEWVQIGMAIHDWDSSPTGKELWHQWSQGGEKYDSEARKTIDAAWKGFRSGKGIGVGTLVKKAMDNGFQFPKTTPNTLVPEKQRQQEPKPSTDKVYSEKTVVSISEDADLKRQIRAAIDQLISTYNQRFIHVVTGSRNAIMVKRANEDYPKQEEWIPMPVPEFKTMLRHERPILIGYRKTREGSEPIFKAPAEIWLNHPDASFCQGITFWPQPCQYHNGRLNLFCGFAVDPIKCPANDPDVQLWKNHLKTIVCKNDTEVARYVLNWLAHLFQYPEIKPKTGIIIKGEQGTGKGTLIEPLMDILGVHGVHLYRPGSVSGRFNGILENRLMIFADEAVFSDRKDCNILKGLVSEPRMETERKGLEAISQRNYNRLVMASDEDHPIRVSGSERRYLVLQMSDEKIQDIDYFARFQAARNNQLAGKLLYTLQQIDLGDWVPMNVPKTKHLMEEKIHHLKPEQAFIYEVLMSGGFCSDAWPARITKPELQGYFRSWLEINRISFHGNIIMKLGRLMKAIGATDGKSGPERWYELNNLQYTRSEFDRVILRGSKSEWP